MTENTGVTQHGSESENPVIDAPTPEPGGRPRTNKDWWPNQLDLSVLRQHSPASNPMLDLDYKAEFSTPRRRRAQAGHRRRHADLAGLVARRLRSLRPALHPDELARGRHVPDRRRPRRRRRRRAAVRAVEQLARQRQPRQGPPPAVAGEAEVRPEDLVGRPARARRQRRPGGHGVRDLRLRLRPRGRLGARGDHLGSRGHLARRRALQRRPRAVRQPRGGPDGADLRQPRGSQRQPRPAARRPRHP